ncbi:4-alpha-glucanotransferase [Corynebacterium yudongzhengii]|uniref:4-alpha-glucanotransferase n=1 Tax=Corynebacterium yudongzhengii TaxID=2080740 RepID=A0A2U1T7L4_9CORY|nr:4-alpha-glucanotransferase [Corynebacterium yudongzhengii]AWB81455.1 4-alpha-glucanotransferase [Corynebacterium yudongzhengii]PWC01973.1 4-alpha-glucanotransferase [Corynebacterium yudongzhengii]
MTNQETLKELAADYGIATSYTSSAGERITASDRTLVTLLKAMGAALSDDPTDHELTAALNERRIQRATRPLPQSVVAVENTEAAFIVHVHDGAPANVWIELEDGGTREVYQDENWNPPFHHDGIDWGEASFHTPPDLPRGYHRLHLESEGCTAETALIITPQRLDSTDTYLEDRRFGVMAQLYSVRSEASWGIGDFHDLGELAALLHREIGADFLLINPLHAAEPVPPVENSPYLPTSRRFTNPIYLRIEDVEELGNLDSDTRAEIAELGASLAETNRSAEAIDRNPIYAAKLDVLREMFHFGLTEQHRAAFRDYCENEGSGLRDFGLWCAARENEQLTGSGRHAIAEDLDELAEFHMWLQFLCDEQLAAAQKRAVDAGMAIGIVTDLAVGVHPGGADAATMGEWMAPEASVGAPPDPYNQQGQDWSQPPFDPEALAEAGYQPWREMMSTVLRHSGGIRVDHILGLFRLFWMPRMQPPSTGTYVQYHHDAMVGVLALEAERAGAVVIGEDLGTFEPWVQDVLADRGVLGTSVLWFESSPTGDGPRRPADYRRLALSSVGTHDLPPTAGYLEGEHIRLRERLGLLETDAATEERQDLDWQAEILDAVSELGFFAGTPLDGQRFAGRGRDERGSTADLLVGLHRWIAATPSALTVTNLVDLVGDVRVQNQPGTNAEQYPNWCIPLCTGDGTPVVIEDLPDIELFHRVGDASRRS